MVIAGLVGSIIAGIILKKTGLYKLVVIIFYMLSVVSWGTFMSSVYSPHIAVVFFAMILLGFFQSGMLPLGFEYAAEITYPVDEGITSGILNTSAHTRNRRRYCRLKHIQYMSHSLRLIPLKFVTLASVCCFMKDDLKRQRAQKVAQSEVSLNFADDGEETLNATNVENL
nr:hypothetical transcript [Hymenolepis microstoma]